MNHLLLFAALQLVSAPAPPLAQWSALAPLPWRTAPVLGPEITAFVVSEVKGNRCVPSKSGVVAFDVVARVTPDGVVHEVVPQSIGCPTVEQFASGLVSGFARNNLREITGGWYRVTVGFTLPE